MKQILNFSCRNESGFSLIELLIYLTILGTLMSAVVFSFNQTMRQSAQQAGIAETKIETGIGLELLRADLEHAGFGLPWEFTAVPIPYTEPVDSTFNDGADTLLASMADFPNNVPRAIISQDNSLASLNGSDYLVIRATNVIRAASGQKWGYVGRDVNNAVDVQTMSRDQGNFNNSDRVIVIRPESGPGQYRQLILNSAMAGGYLAVPTIAGLANFAPPPTPNDPDGERYLIYGLDQDPDNLNIISRPFNRADYFINDSNVPVHCAPNTGVLEKATVNQANNNFTFMPIMDCVADFQIVYYRDTNGDGGWDQRFNADGLNGLSSQQIRDEIKAIRFYVLTHEGDIDRSYTHPNPTINVGEVAEDGANLLAGAGRQFDINAGIGGNWANYRWKVESVAVTPKNLR